MLIDIIRVLIKEWYIKKIVLKNCIQYIKILKL